MMKTSRKPVFSSPRSGGRGMSEYTVVLLGIGFLLLIWFIESAGNAWIFGRGSLWEEMFSTEPQEIWLRSLSTVALVLAIGALHQLFKRLHQANQRLVLAQVCMEATDDGIFLAKRNGDVVYANKACAEASGYSVEALCSMNISDVSNSFSSERWSEVWKDLDEFPVRWVEFDCRTQSGTTFPAECSLAKIRYEEEELVCGFARNITERKEIERSLRASESLYRSLLDISPDAILVISPDRKIVVSNKRALDLHGYEEPDSLVGQPAGDLLPPEEFDLLAKSGQQAFERGVVRGIECRMLRKDGTSFPAEINIAGVLDGEGHPQYLVGIARDTTDRKLTEATLVESEEFYRTLIETIPDAVVLVTLGRNLILINQRAVGLFRLKDRTTLVGRPFVNFVVPERREAAMEGLKSLGDQRMIQNASISLLREDGTVFPAEVNCSVVEGRDGSATAFMAVIRDVEERNATEEALRKSEALYRALIKTSPDSIAVFDSDLRYTMVNDQTVDMLGCQSTEDVLGRPVEEFVMPEYRAQIERARSDLAEGKIRRNIEYVFKRKDGKAVPVEVSTSVVRDEQNRPIAITGVARDVSERKRLEAEMLQVRDQEQRRIGQDLHDSVCSQIAGVSFLCASLEKSLKDLPAQAEEARNITDLLRSVMVEVRGIAQGLSPVPLGPEGLMAALENLAVEIEDKMGISCMYECPSPVRIEENLKATHLFRIAQEAISNGVRHGHASSITLAIHREGSKARLEISDDGEGIPVPLPEKKGNGIGIMRYRAGLIRGILEIERAPSRGTVVRCAFPVE